MNSIHDISILHIVKGIDIGGHNGGAEFFGINLSRSLRKQGINVSFCAFLKYETQVEQHWINTLNSEGINVFFACPSMSPDLRAAKKKIKNWLDDHPTLIIHSHYQIGTITAALLKRAGNYEYLIRTVHAGLEFGSGIKGFISRILIRDILYPFLVDYEIGVSQTITHELNRQKVRRISRKTATWIPNAIPEQVDLGLPYESFSNYNIPENSHKWIVTTIGVFVPIKNLDVLIKAMPEVLRQIPQAKLLLVGSGPELEPLMGLSKNLGISESCLFLGQQQNIHPILKQSNLLVLPSRSEGTSTVILEAMQNRIPVIASDIPGNRELIRHNINGWLVPVDDIDELANAIVRAYHEPEVINKMVDIAYSHIDTYYLSNVSMKYIDFYKTILQTV